MMSQWCLDVAQWPCKHEVMSLMPGAATYTELTSLAALLSEMSLPQRLPAMLEIGSTSTTTVSGLKRIDYSR